ncbi:MAG: hypothetical protein ACRD5M_08595 [Candidatus Acidiferrales bacterium]
MAAADLVLGKPYIVATYLAFAGLGVYLFEGGDPGFAWVLSKFVFGSLFVGFVFLLYSYAGDQIRWRRSKVHGDE